MRTILSYEQDESRDWLRQIAMNSGLEVSGDDCVPYSKLTTRLVQGDVELVVLQMGTDSARALAAIQEAVGKGPTPIIAIGPTNDPQLILHVLRAGAREYLDQANPREEFTNALEKLRQSGAVRLKCGQTIAVIGAIPGTGVTTVASGLAFSFAEKHPQQVVLGELGGGVPDLALNLDLEPKNHVSQVLSDWERMDIKTIRQALTDHPSGLQILADPPGVLETTPVQPPAGKQIVALLRTLFDYVVVDLGHAVTNPGIQGILDFAEKIVVVFRLDVPSLRLTHALLKRLIDLGVDKEKIRVVANRYGQRKQLSWKKAEETLGFPVGIWVPDDPGRINQALNKGVPVSSAGWSKLSKSFHKLAASVNGVDTASKKKK